MKRNNISLEEISRLIDDSDNIVIICHAHPDGDTLGSARALSLIARGKRVCCVCADRVPDSLRFIFPGGGCILPSELGYEPGLIIAVDIATKELMGECADIFGGRIGLKIDHHEKGEDFAPLYYTDSSASSAAEIVWQIAKLCARTDPDVADAVYSGLVTDTGCMRYSNTTSRTLRTAAELKDRGADSERINSEVFETRSPAELAAIRLALNTMKYSEDGKIVYVLADRKLKEEYGVGDDQMHTISAFLKEIGGPVLSLVIRQCDGSDTDYKISVRSRAPYDACEICALFGGGGHVRAAGASCSFDSPCEAEKKILEKVLDYING